MGTIMKIKLLSIEDNIMDFTFTPGIGGWILWRLGVIRFWHKYPLKKYYRVT